MDDQLLMMDRRGFLEETYWTYSYSPIRETDGRVAGVFTATNDTTARVVTARRLDTLRALGDVSAVRATSPEQAARGALEVLARNPVDLPFAFVCLDDGAGLCLADARGVPDEALLREIVADRSRAVPRVHHTGEPVVSTGLATRYPGAFPAPLDGPLGAQPPDTAVVLPLAAAGDEERPGVLVLGVAPYRPLDRDHRAFLDLVAGQVSGALGDARAHAAQRRRAEALAELDRAKTEFFTGVSHEFRTPLTLIMGPIGELRAGPAAADPAVREALDTVHRNGLRLGRLVDSVLDFSRLQAGRVRGDFRPVDLAACTADLAALFRSAMEGAGLEYRVDCPDLGEPVYVDGEMWEKVVLNLISNALKFTLHGRVEVALRREDGEAVLRVTDTGAGIPAEDLPRVFERFHRVERTSARSHEGAGIGLALVRELVELHGGRVDVASDRGAGTVFTVRVPLGGDHLPARAADAVPPRVGDGAAAAAFVAEAERWLPADEATSTDGAPRPGRVLVADDNADMRAYLRRLLAARWAVETVRDGAAVLAAVHDDPPDLVLSDVMMPGLDGLALVAALRADPLTAHVPVVLVSARAGAGASVQGLAAGADDYLVKPFEPDELVARVEAHLRLGRARRAARDTAPVDTPGMTWVSDRAGGLLHVNRAWREFAGGADADQLGTGWKARVHPDDAAAHDARAATARAAGVGWESEYRMRRADGEYRWLLEHAVPVGGTGDPDAVTGWVGSCVDVTDRRRTAERALHAERERYRTLVEQSPVGIWTADAEGRMTFVNDRIVELCGRTGEEIRRAGWALQLHPEDVAAVRRDWPAAVAAGADWDGEYRVFDAAGRVRHLISSARPLRDEHGAVTGFLGTAVDVTDQRQAEHARRETAAVQAARAVSDAAAARLRAMVGGLAAIVWEADWDADARLLRFTFVSERAEELLGHPVRSWLADPGFWPGLVHAEDRAAVVAETAAHTADGRDQRPALPGRRGRRAHRLAAPGRARRGRRGRAAAARPGAHRRRHRAGAGRARHRPARRERHAAGRTRLAGAAARLARADADGRARRRRDRLGPRPRPAAAAHRRRAPRTRGGAVVAQPGPVEDPAAARRGARRGPPRRPPGHRRAAQRGRQERRGPRRPPRPRRPHAPARPVGRHRPAARRARPRVLRPGARLRRRRPRARGRAGQARGAHGGGRPQADPRAPPAGRGRRPGVRRLGGGGRAAPRRPADERPRRGRDERLPAGPRPRAAARAQRRLPRRGPRGVRDHPPRRRRPARHGRAHRGGGVAARARRLAAGVPASRELRRRRGPARCGGAPADRERPDGRRDRRQLHHRAGVPARRARVRARAEHAGRARVRAGRHRRPQADDRGDAPGQPAAPGAPPARGHRPRRAVPARRARGGDRRRLVRRHPARRPPRRRRRGRRRRRARHPRRRGDGPAAQRAVRLPARGARAGARARAPRPVRRPGARRGRLHGRLPDPRHPHR